MSGGAEIKDRVAISRKMDEHGERKNGPDDARRIEELIAVIHGLPDVRSDKIRSVRQSVESGAYDIDPRQIAERLLEEGL